MAIRAVFFIPPQNISKQELGIEVSVKAGYIRAFGHLAGCRERVYPCHNKTMKED